MKYPRWIDFVAELPKTATGKVQRYVLRNQLAGEDDASAAEPTPEPEGGS